MDIEKQIHARWAADATLNGLLPETKLATGIYFPPEDDADDDGNPEFPYATLTRPGDTPEEYYNDGSSIEAVQVRITVYHQKSSYDEGVAIVDAIKAAFDRSMFSLTGNSDKVLHMERLSYAPLQDQASGDWFFVVDYMCHVFLGSGT